MSFEGLIHAEELHNEVANEMLGFGDELAVRTGGVITEAGIAADPITEDDNHSAAFFDETFGRVKSARLFFEARES